MKATDTHKFETTMVGESTKFTIDATGKMFGILLERLYTNKIRAVIRELCSNALDSHIEAGMSGIPFDVHLPSHLDPTFRVRDYGVSMSHDKITGLYARVGGSHKDDTNELVGMLGLGSKSPFAYASAFLVVARLNGKKRTYAATMGADGVPSIMLLSTEESDEAQGIEISVAVEGKDFHDFKREMRHVAAGFDPVPNVDGIEIETAQPIYMASDGSFAIYNHDDLPDGARLYIRQGCVLYPVTDQALVRPVEAVLPWFKAVVIDVPIGDVDITPSREALSLTDRTKRKLTMHLERFSNRVALDVEEAVADQPNLLEATRFWFGGENALADIFTIKPQFRNDTLSAYLPFKGGKGWTPPTIKEGNDKKPKVLDKIHWKQVQDKVFVIKRTDVKLVRAGIRYKQFVDGSPKPVILLTDPSGKVIERMMTLLGVQRDQFVNLADIPDPGPPEAVKRAQKGLSGVFRLDGGVNYSAVNELDFNSDFLWASVPGRMSKQEAGTLSDSVRRLAGYGVSKPVYVFAGKALDRWSPDPEKALQATLAATEKRMRSTLIAKYADHVVANNLGKDMCEAAGLPYRPMNIGWHALREFQDRLGFKWQQVAERIAHHRTSAFKTKYPMLTNPSKEDKLAYIEMVNLAHDGADKV